VVGGKTGRERSSLRTMAKNKNKKSYVGFRFCGIFCTVWSTSLLHASSFLHFSHILLQIIFFLKNIG